MKPIDLPNGRSWRTQTAALAHFKDMLARYSDNQIVESRSDHDDLIALLERYDAVITDSPPKIGSGIEHFFRRRNVGEGYSTPGFWVHRTNGTDTDFSYIDAVKGQPKSNAQEFYDACRGAVATDLLVAKKRHFETHGDAAGRVPCDLSDELISFAEAHLDHAYPTFGQLVVSFRAARGWQHGCPLEFSHHRQTLRRRPPFLTRPQRRHFGDFIGAPRFCGSSHAHAIYPCRQDNGGPR